MIDISTEHLILIRDVPHRLPPRPTGRHVHISAVYRWVQRGVRGVRLESIRIGGTSYTSTEALQRFADYLSRAPTADPVTQIRTTVSRQKQIEGATRAVEAIMAGRRPGQRESAADRGRAPDPDSDGAPKGALDASSGEHAG